MAATPPSSVPRLIVLGNFDGVHQGHRKVLESAYQQADGLELTALTFDPHPAQVLRGAAPALLTRLAEKRRLLAELPGQPSVLVLPFDQSLAQLTAEEFVREILVQRFCARKVLVGANFRFGKGRLGDLSLLQSLGAELGFEAAALPLVELEGQALSSTRARAAIAAGNLQEARAILGRDHAVVGEVVAGDGRGAEFGFPTANLAGVLELLPPAGVYAVRVQRSSAPLCSSEAASWGPSWLGVAHWGERPTVDRPSSLEVHLLDQSLDLYGAELRVELVAQLRPVVRFSGVEELKAQITRDIAEARKALLT